MRKPSRPKNDAHREDRQPPTAHPASKERKPARRTFSRAQELQFQKLLAQFRGKVEHVALTLYTQNPKAARLFDLRSAGTAALMIAVSRAVSVGESPEWPDIEAEILDAMHILGGDQDSPDALIDNRDFLLQTKYGDGLTPEGARHLAGIDHLLEIDEAEQAARLDATARERLARIEDGLTRLEAAIRELRTLHPR